LIGLILYVAVASEGRWRAEHLILLALAPAVTVNIWCGQNGFFITALLVGGLLQLDRRPALAGILFGALSIKPQLGVLLPVMLALTGRWRTIIAAGATTLLLLGLACLVFGTSVWTAYFNDAMPTQAKVFLRDYEHFMTHMPTVFMNARVAGSPLRFAYLLQAIVSLGAFTAVVWTFWTRRDRVLSNALFVTATFVVTPYAFNYDMVVFGWVILGRNLSLRSWYDPDRLTALQRRT
jgi:alpha-1,2-mannosyltransferase